MGNPLSPFLTKLFLSTFWIEIKREPQSFPRIGQRYVDEVFNVFDPKIHVTA